MPKTHLHAPYRSTDQGSWSPNKSPIRQAGEEFSSPTSPHKYESDCREPQNPSQRWEPYPLAGLGHLWGPANGEMNILSVSACVSELYIATPAIVRAPLTAGNTFTENTCICMRLVVPQLCFFFLKKKGQLMFFVCFLWILIDTQRHSP